MTSAQYRDYTVTIKKHYFAKYAKKTRYDIKKLLLRLKPRRISENRNSYRYAYMIF